MSIGLLTQTESLDNGAITIDVAIVKIFKQSTALTYELGEAACCPVILVVLLQVLSEVLDAVSKESDLALCRTCVSC